MKRCLIVFAKEPEKGKVKTRLKTLLGDEGCVRLYKAFLKDTFRIVRNSDCEMKVLAYHSVSAPSFLKKNAPGLIVHKQKGRNLGARMLHASIFARQIDAEAVVIIGSDSPAMPAHYIERAFDLLKKKDVVLGPSTDGGYYLIGFLKASSALFRGVEWSSAKVLRQTVANIKALRRSVALLPRYWDIDTPEDLKRFRRELLRGKGADAPWTKKCLTKTVL